MKKIIISLLIALSAIFAVSANDANVTVKVDNNGIQAKVERIKELAEKLKTDSASRAAISELTDSLCKQLNDTLVTINAAASSDNDEFQFDFKDDASEIKEISDHTSSILEDFVLPIILISVPFFATVIIVISLLIYNYKKRNRRYRLIETAIAHNYEIPNYLINEPQTKSQAKAAKNDNQQFLDNITTKKEIQSSIVMIAVGIGLFCAFGTNFVGYLCVIPILIGAGRLAIVLLERRSAQNEYVQNQFEEAFTDPQQKKSADIPTAEPVEQGNDPEPPVIPTDDNK